MCRVPTTPRAPRRPRPPAIPRIIAHRGASGYRPEHSRAAYELAIAMGADAVEPDIVATRDGVLVLRHENEISGTTDVAEHPAFADRRTTKRIDGQRVTGWFTEDFTWDELQLLTVRERMPDVRPANTAFDGEERILSLAELLAMLEGTGVGLVAELKHATYFASLGLDLAPLLAAELARAGWSRGRDLVVECFETRVLRDVAALGVEATLVFLIEASGASADEVAERGRAARTFAQHITDEGLADLAEEYDGVSVNKRLLLATDGHGRVTGATDLVDRAHGAGLLVYCWTLRAENRFLARNLRHPGGPRAQGDWMREFHLLMQTGLDGVFADQPDLAREARAALSWPGSP